MKIVLVVHCFFPTRYHGTEAYTLDLAKHWIEAGHDVTVLTANFPGDSSPDEAVYRYRYQDVPVICFNRSRLPYQRFSQTWLDERVRETLGALLGELSPDLIHVTHLMNHSAVLIDLARERGIPLTATFTDFFGLCLNSKLQAVDGSLCWGPSATRVNCMTCRVAEMATQASAPNWVKRAWSPRRAKLVATAAKVVSLTPLLRSNSVLTELQEIAERPVVLRMRYEQAYRLAIAPTRFLSDAYWSNGFTLPMVNVHFGVDVDRRPKPVREPGSIPVVGFIGQIARHKGPDLLLQAFRRIPLGRARIQLWGDLGQEPTYSAYLKELAKDHDVQFMGTFGKSQMAEVMAGIDVLVLPSRWYENSPLVLLAALATHTPVVVADVPGMTEFVDKGVNGFHFARGDALDLERVLKEMIDDPDCLTKMSLKTNYERTGKDMALETLALVLSAVERNRPLSAATRPSA